MSYSGMRYTEKEARTEYEATVKENMLLFLNNWDDYIETLLSDNNDYFNIIREMRKDMLTKLRDGEIDQKDAGKYEVEIFFKYLKLKDQV